MHPMLFFLLSSISFFLLLLLLLKNPLPLKLPSWVNELSLLSLLLCKESLAHLIPHLKNYKLTITHIFKFSYTEFTNRNRVSRTEELGVHAELDKATMTILDLPELPLDLILGKLAPVELLNVTEVCTYLRDIATRDHLWERHFSERWGRIISECARREWIHFVSAKESKRNESAGWLLEILSCVLPCSWFMSPKAENNLKNSGSVMAWYLALESGRFSFPAQVYNRELINGHVGFVLSCYDAEFSYDARTDTFHARYPSHGKRVTDVEEGVKWDRIRAPPIDTPPHDLHISNCLNDLRPGDHIEIQWRRNKEFPYGWWYGVVGHLESCDGDEHQCHCYDSDTIVLEFNHYSSSSRWRRTSVDRKHHREEGNEAYGFYGGIRKLYDEHEISIWKQLWPTEILE
ncbi:F-box protein At2g32560-like [Asparagus officinalis]|uniref:F-box protein At2g32560-like n=1 Tax=Asparagus officinalis TaxID=4686 RepID=UPI00098E1F6C|nr:F-box protein At2g32560-like [Asparagus officinalis]